MGGDFEFTRQGAAIGFFDLPSSLAGLFDAFFDGFVVVWHFVC
jgi:hypothetical protein